MKNRASLIILIPVLAISCAVLAKPDSDGDKDHEVAIEFKQAPSAVQNTIKKATKVDAITELERVTHDGIAVYDVEFKVGEATGSLTIAASGHVIESELEVATSKLPRAVRETIKKKFPKAEIVTAEALTFHTYTIVVKVDGEHHGVNVLASGYMDSDDDDEDEHVSEDVDEDEDEEHEDDDDEGHDDD